MSPELRAALEAIGVRETDANGKPDPVWAAFAALNVEPLSPDAVRRIGAEIKAEVAAGMRQARKVEWTRALWLRVACVVAGGFAVWTFGVLVGMTL